MTPCDLTKKWLASCVRLSIYLLARDFLVTAKWKQQFFSGKSQSKQRVFPQGELRRRQCSSAFSGEEDSRAPTRDVFKICAHSCALLKSLQYQMLSQNTNLQPPPGLANLPMNLKTCLAKGMKMMLQWKKFYNGYKIPFYNVISATTTITPWIIDTCFLSW